MSFPLEDTIVAIASAPGGAARGIVRLSGPDALETIGGLFLVSGQPFLLKSRVPQHMSGSFQIDPPLRWVPASLYVWPSSRSYTGQPTAEVHTIGSPPLLESVLRKLCKNGARLAQPGEFTLRAFLTGRLDLPQAEAVLGVIDARSDRQLRTALQQLAGGLSIALHDLRNQLLDLLADLEAGLDFVDEDIQFISTDRLTAALSSARDQLEILLTRIESRGETSHKPRIVLRGRPNTGKSTLWNALAGHERAIVSDVPGTTRDYLSTEVRCGGIDCLLIDTAGVSSQDSQKEIDAEAQRMTHSVSGTSDVELLCIDATRELDSWESSELRSGSTNVERVVVLTKLDAAPFGPIVDLARGVNAIETSSRTGSGLEILRAALESLLISRESLESGAIASTAVRCRESIRRASESVQRSWQLASDGSGEELIAAEVRCALDELGLVVGAVYTDDILDRVFSRFCIGK